MRINIFVGPYVDCRSEQQLFFLPSPELDKALIDLMDDGKRLRWAMPGAVPRQIKVGKKKLWQYCGIPIERRQKIERWPMYFPAASAFDLGTSTVWADADPAAEIEWFQAAFAAELELLSKAFTLPPQVNWGLVYWPDL